MSNHLYEEIKLLFGESVTVLSKQKDITNAGHYLIFDSFNRVNAGKGDFFFSVYIVVKSLSDSSSIFEKIDRDLESVMKALLNGKKIYCTGVDLVDFTSSTFVYRFKIKVEKEI